MDNDYIRQIIKNQYSKLNSNDVRILYDYVIKIKHAIQKLFYIDPQWISSDDIIAMSLLILPYVNNTENLTGFLELYTAKEVGHSDINMEPKYVFSNIQYNRCKRNNGKDIEQQDYSDILEYMHHNYLLLLDTIQTISHRLYVNWINIVPMSLNNYKELPVYIKTQLNIQHKQLSEWNPYTQDIDKIQMGLNVARIYETMSNELYNNILPVKWLIYDVVSLDKNKIYPILIIINELFDLNNKNVEHFTELWTQFISSTIESQTDTDINGITYSPDEILRLLRAIILAHDRSLKFANSNTEDGEEIIILLRKELKQ